MVLNNYFNKIIHALFRRKVFSQEVRKILLRRLPTENHSILNLINYNIFKLFRGRKSKRLVIVSEKYACSDSWDMREIFKKKISLGAVQRQRSTFLVAAPLMILYTRQITNKKDKIIIPSQNLSLNQLFILILYQVCKQPIIKKIILPNFRDFTRLNL